MLSKSIYVKSITNLSDARYCAGMGVEFLGVCVDEGSENYLPLPAYNEIRNWLVGVEWIAESAATEVEEIVRLLNHYELDRIAVEDDVVAAALHQHEFEVIIETDALGVGSNSAVADASVIVNLGEAEVPSFLALWKDRLSGMYLKGDFSAETLKVLNATTALKGVVLAGGTEVRPGYKSMDDLIDAIEIFEID